MPISASFAIFAPSFLDFLADRQIMENISVKQYADKYGISERTARNYCASGKIDGAIMIGKTWSVPSDATLPQRKKRIKQSPLLTTLREQQQSKLKGGIYHRVQIDLTYNSNHIEGSRLSHEQTRYIFETSTIGVTDEAIQVDDIIETVNHFRCIDEVIRDTHAKLTESYFNVGDYKRLPNEVGGMETTPPEQVHRELKDLLTEYHRNRTHSFESILDFHHRFESIHPFQDGNGRVGRLIMFKECLAAGIVPFIITDDLKMFYYRGLREWPRVQAYLLDTCLTAQDQFKALLDYFQIKY